MTHQDIIALPNPKLREVSKAVAAITPSVKKLAADMRAATIDWDAQRPHELTVALAAIQVAAAKRVVIVRHDLLDKDNQEYITLINPEIIEASGQVNEEPEGCLSVKDVYGLVKRHSKIRVKALNEQGKVIKFTAKGFLARVLQHEIDHTNGQLFIDHVENDKFFKLERNGELKPLSKDEVAQYRLLWQ